MKIGPYTLDNNLFLAPMAGITDLPYRRLCRKFGAALTVSEMTSSDPSLWNTRKSRLRRVFTDEVAPRSVQIAGTNPKRMAEAAKFNVDLGAQIIDINMGCPAKKVCNVQAGSALMKNEPLVQSILEAVVDAVDVPVTLKIRTGWSPEQRNGMQIAMLAQNSGIQLLSVHGRTRACAYKGAVEYDTIKDIKQSVSIPVIANGDIDDPEKAAYVLKYTGADGLMIGRAAQGNPWIFEEILHYLETGEALASPTLENQQEVILEHLDELHRFYGETVGVRIARKHIGWYLARFSESESWRLRLVQTDSTKEQLWLLTSFFEKQAIRNQTMELAA